MVVHADLLYGRRGPEPIYKSYDLADFGGYDRLRLVDTTAASPTSPSIHRVHRGPSITTWRPRSYGNAEAASAGAAKSWFSGPDQHNGIVQHGSRPESFMAMPRRTSFSDNPVPSSPTSPLVDDNTVANTIFNATTRYGRRQGKGINLTLRITGLMLRRTIPTGI